MQERAGQSAGILVGYDLYRQLMVFGATDEGDVYGVYSVIEEPHVRGIEDFAIELHVVDDLPGASAFQGARDAYLDVVSAFVPCREVQLQLDFFILRRRRGESEVA